MAPRNKRPAPRAKAQTQDTRVNDSFVNFAARLGMGTDNMASQAGYQTDYVSRNRVLLESAYRSSWIIGKAIDDYAEDMTREGIELQAEVLEPDEIEQLERAATGLGIWPALTNSIKWARLYGGCVAVLLIDGQKPETPLRLDTIKKDQFKGLLVLDRWILMPGNKPITELGPDMGKPLFYNVQQDSMGLQSQKIHHSRVVRLEGVELPYWQRVAENGWGQSVAERMWDRLIAFDSATQGAAQLMYKAHLRTYKVEGLRDIIAAGGKIFDGLVAQIDMIRKFQSSEGLTLMDAKDEFEAHSYTFAGMAEMILQFGEQISGACGIPLVRLFGQSPAGLNSTGDSDWRNYYDNIKREQEHQLRRGVGKIYNALYRSTFGKEPPENFDFKFKSLWQMTDEQKADISDKGTTTICKAFDSGVIGRATALSELRALSDKTGMWSNITDDLVNEAEDEPPPVPEGTDPNADPEEITAPNEKT